MVSIISSELASRVSLEEAFGEVAQQTPRDLVDVGSQRLVVNQLEQANPWLVSQSRLHARVLCHDAARPLASNLYDRAPHSASA
jgi:hypothetical protein